MTEAALKPVLILLTEGFADWETGLLAAATMEDGLVLRHASPDGGDVTSLGGMRVTGLAPFQPQGDEVIVLCGGMIWETPAAPDLTATLTSVRAGKQTIAAICGAVGALARAGMLAGLRHSSNGRSWLAHVAPGYAGAEFHQDSPRAVADQGIITAAGTAPASFAVEVLRAAGFSDEKLAEYRAMLGAEHR